MSNSSWVSTARETSRLLGRHLGPFCWVMRHDVVVWRGPDNDLHEIRLVPYTWPECAGDDAPPAFRFAINDLPPLWPASLGPKRKERLGYAPDQPLESIHASSKRLEWTVSPDELPATVAWLADYWPRFCREEDDLPAPPYPSTAWDPWVISYGWSRQAWIADTAYEARRERRRQEAGARRAARAAEASPATPTPSRVPICPDYTASGGVRRCTSYRTGGGCDLHPHEACVEWRRVNPHASGPRPTA